MIQYWVNVLPKDIVQQCKQGHFIQSANGKEVSLKRMGKGDKVLFYSPKDTAMGQKCQSFTSVGTIVDDKMYQADLAQGNKPYRRDIIFEKAKDVSIIPLIQQLEFIRSKSRWGEMFRLDLIQINADDFRFVSTLMQQHKMG
jgi:predicted RNA-binding protein